VVDSSSTILRIEKVPRFAKRNGGELEYGQVEKL